MESLESKLRELRQRTGLDRKEISKMLFVASVTVLILSIHGAMTLESASDNVGESTQELESTYAIVSSDSFQSALNRLQSVRADIAQQVETASEGFESTESTVDSLREAEQELEEGKTVYQWLVVSGILGIVGSITVLYI